MVLARKRRGGTRALYTFTSFSGQSDFASQKSCVCAVTTSQNPPVLLPRKSVCRHTLPHRRVRRQPLFRGSRKQRYNTLDFASKIVCQQGCSRPYWKPSVKGMLPLQSLIFLAVVYTNCKNAACITCSENAKGSLCGCVAQTSFWAEMQKKGTIVSSTFPRSARRGREIRNGEKTQYSKARDGSV